MADTKFCENCGHPQPKPYTSTRRYRCTSCNGLVCHFCINRDIPARCSNVAKCEVRRRERAKAQKKKKGVKLDAD